MLSTGTTVSLRDRGPRRGTGSQSNWIPPPLGRRCCCSDVGVIDGGALLPLRFLPTTAGPPWAGPGSMVGVGEESRCKGKAVFGGEIVIVRFMTRAEKFFIDGCKLGGWMGIFAEILKDLKRYCGLGFGGERNID